MELAAVTSSPATFAPHRETARPAKRYPTKQAYDKKERPGLCERPAVNVDVIVVDLSRSGDGITVCAVAIGARTG